MMEDQVTETGSKRKRSSKRLEWWYFYITIGVIVFLYTYLENTGGFDGKFFGVLFWSYIVISGFIYIYLKRKFVSLKEDDME